MNQPSSIVPSAPGRATPVWRQLAIDVVIAAVLFAGAGVWSARFWNAWIANGGQPTYYQSYFEPAVMVACGHGFGVSAAPRPKVLDEFLSLRRDAMVCSDLPADLVVGRQGLYQGAWIYLQTTVGWAWWLLGISWSRMGPLFGVLFGLVIALAYGICRIGMGRAAGLVCALGLTTSYIHLLNLPHLRDYAKAPFTLALVFILGLLVTLPVRRVSLLACAVAYGAVLGIGYGFRTDFLVNLPVFLLAVFAFVDGGLFKNLGLKAAAVVLFLATFAVVSWPAASVVYAQGGCQWHVSLLGLQAPFDEYLHVAPAPYDFGYAYSDGYISQTIDGFNQRMNPGAGPLGFCSHEYDVQSGGYLRAIVFTFPADLITRAYGSVLQIAELPFLSWASPLPGWANGLYEARESFLRPKIGWGASIIAIALLIASAGSLRLGLFLLFFTAYFGGYPAIQFQERHHFHLEFMTWWAAGFIVHQVIAKAWAARRQRPSWAPIAAGMRRSVAFVAIAVVLVIGGLSAARWQQRRAATAMLSAYIKAPKEAIPVTGVLGELPREAWPQFLEVDLDQARCGRRPAVTFRYNPQTRDGDFSRTVVVSRLSRMPGVTRILQPVFASFRGLEFSDGTPGCVTGVYRFTDLHPFPVLLGVTLPPEWPTTLPLYQRLADWEADPSLPPFAPMPPVPTWTNASGKAVGMNPLGLLRLAGDRSTAGYQLTSPRVAAPVGASVFVRTNLSQSRGRVCLGALNGTGQKWLSPADGVRQEMRFTIDDSGGFIVAVANCNAVETSSPSAFRLSAASYAVE